MWSCIRMAETGSRTSCSALNDGVVTTLVFVIAVSGVAASRIVLVALGEVIAGGISMTLGGFLASRTAREIVDERVATERHEIRSEPEEERTELREIYRAKGPSRRTARPSHR